MNFTREGHIQIVSSKSKVLMNLFLMAGHSKRELKFRWFELIFIVVILLLTAAVVGLIVYPEIINPFLPVTLDSLDPPKFVYSDGDQNLYISGKNGQRVKLIFSSVDMSNLADPDWSPDGKYIVFSADVDGNTDLYRIDYNGSNLLRLTTHSSYDIDPDWSPDSSQIVFYSGRDKIYHRNLFIVDVDGSEVREIRDRRMVWYPDWWPTGNHILCQALYNNLYTLYLVDPKGGVGYPITEGVFTGGRREMIYSAPAVSPDGKFVAYTTDHKLHILNIDLSDDRIIAAHSQASKPAWSPNGEYLIYQSNGGLSMIDMRSLEIQYLNNLPSKSGMYRGVSWGPLE